MNVELRIKSEKWRINAN